MAGVTFHETTKRFKNITAVDSLSLEVKDKEFMVLVGPSGCGKTTALRMVAGLEEVTSGEIRIGDVVVNDVPPKDRDIAMVFQNYALYPHMNVYDNIAFGLKLRQLKGVFWQWTHLAEARRRRQSIDARVRDAAEMLGLADLLRRRPRELSGGQRQRVALGRAIVREPKVFLMDEPLSNLDAKLRVQTRAELIRLHRRLGITTIYVTHDQVEAMTMGDRIAVMRDGILQQCDIPEHVYRWPANRFVAGFIGTPPMNFIFGEVTKDGPLGVRVNEELVIPVPPDRAATLEAYRGRRVEIGIRPEDIFPRNNGVAGAAFQAVVDVIEPMGANDTYYLALGPHSLVATVPAEQTRKEGEKADFVLNVDKVHLFDCETEAAIR
ncbi:MAG: ABC transporter ATP-binding protein [Fimbriimonadia bacterium]